MNTLICKLAFSPWLIFYANWFLSVCILYFVDGFRRSFERIYRYVLFAFGRLCCVYGNCVDSSSTSTDLLLSFRMWITKVRIAVHNERKSKEYTTHGDRAILVRAQRRQTVRSSTHFVRLVLKMNCVHKIYALATGKIFESGTMCDEQRWEQTEKMNEGETMIDIPYTEKEKRNERKKERNKKKNTALTSNKFIYICEMKSRQRSEIECFTNLEQINNK